MNLLEVCTKKEIELIKNAGIEDESKIMIKKYLLLGGTFSVLICELR